MRSFQRSRHRRRLGSLIRSFGVVATSFLTHGVHRFALLAFVCIISLSLSMSLVLSSLLIRAVSQWEWENTAAFARREVELAGLEPLFSAAQTLETRERWAREMSRVFVGLPEVARVKVWDRAGTVIWSDAPRLVGQRFPNNHELMVALGGTVAVEIKEPVKTENAYERRSVPLAEVYVPIVSKATGTVVGAIEVYKIPVRLMDTIWWSRVVIWTISLTGGVALFFVLLPLFRHVYRVQEQAHHAYSARLEREVAERTRELSQTQERLVQAQKMEAVGRLAGGVAHDFNNILSIIIGRTALLRDQCGADHGLERHMHVIDKTAQRAASLTRQLLAFSRKQVLQPTVLDFNALVGNLGTMLCRLIGEDITLRTALGPSLAPVKADPGQLEQVLMNLVVNARDAMPRGGRVTLETANVVLDATYAATHAEVRPGRYVLLAVSDTGTGMDSVTLAHVFEPFFTTKGPGKGTGLGLAMVYGIVKQSGGHIAVYSEVGHGATFKIYLPAVDQPVETGEDQTPTSPPTGSETVLLVEDEKELCDLVGEVLEASGYRVLAAHDCADAVRICDEHAGTIDLLLTDVIMPQMSGRELADRLRPRRPAMKVLYVSGYTDSAIVQHGVLEPGIAFLQKPFAPADVAQKVREVLDGSPQVTAVAAVR